jgi:acetate kinase
LAKEASTNPASPRILTINGGSSSIKFALFEAGEAGNSLCRILEGGIERIGLPEATLRVKGLNKADKFSRPLAAPNHTVAVRALMDWIEQRSGREALTAVGHRVVHGGPRYSKPQLITKEMVEELRQLSPFDPEHLPEEILLTEAFHRRFPDLPQVACFDTAFHHDLPRVARLLPIPRRYEAQGVRRYGFHASMGFTPTAGVPMCTRSGDLDPGLVWYLARTEKRNLANAGVISSETSKSSVRVIRTDEEWMIASTVCRVLDPTTQEQQVHESKQAVCKG